MGGEPQWWGYMGRHYKKAAITSQEEGPHPMQKLLVP